MTRTLCLAVALAASLALADTVTLVETGPNKISVIKVVRDATGLGLAQCKTLVESAPQVVARGQSPEAAAALVKQLSAVGATATVTPEAGAKQPTGVGASHEGSWDVVVAEVGPQKIMVIKLVREATGLGLKAAKDLVESTPPFTVKRGVAKADAQALAAKLGEAGARASAVLQKD